MSAIDSAKEFYQQLLLSNVGSPMCTGGHRPVRTHITSLLRLIRPQYQHALTSMSDQDREYMLRLKPDMDTHVLMCDAPEALSTIEHYAEQARSSQRAMQDR